MKREDHNTEMIEADRFHKPNPLVTSKPLLTQSQQKTFGFLLYKSFPKIKETDVFKVNISEFLKNTIGEDNHTLGKKIIKDLMEPRFIHGSLDTRVWEAMPYIQYAKWNGELGYIEFQFATKLLNYIRSKDFQYTSVDINLLSQFESKYSLFLWQLFLRYRGIGRTPEYDLELLKEHMGLENLENKEFFRKLRKWIDEILNKSEIYINTHKDKDYRTSKIWFQIRTKLNKQKKHANKDYVFNYLQIWGFISNEIDVIFKLYNHDIIEQIVKRVKENNRIKYHRKYVLSCLRKEQKKEVNLLS